MNLDELNDTPPWDWPRGTGRKLLDVLRDAKGAASDRLIAADLAGSLTVMSDDIAEALLAIVRSADQPEELRARAAISLGPALEAADTEALGGGDWDAPIS